MKRDSVNKSFQELSAYLGSYNLTAITAEAEFNKGLKSSYKRYHALLIWHANLSKGCIWPTKKTKSKEFSAYFSECISDLCLAIFLYSHGTYKPSFLILRSSLENFIKCICIHEDQKVLNIKSVYEIVGIGKQTGIITSSDSASKHYKKIMDYYSDLCGFVHTADIAHMTLTNAVGVYPLFDKANATECEKMMRACITSMCCILCVMFRARFRSMHHSEQDLISDILPKLVRKELGGLS